MVLFNYGFELACFQRSILDFRASPSEPERGQDTQALDL